VHFVGYITEEKEKENVTHNKLSWVEKQREMKRDSELRNRERGIIDLGVERVGAFWQKSNFIYSHRKGIAIPLLFEWNTYSSS
jgi:Na+-transporting NADH:ubiquinone oxidoreductase subunit NqrA